VSDRARTGSHPKPALDTLLGEDALAPLIRRARWLDTLSRHLHARLPFPLNQHARLGNIEGETLVYLVDAPVWHARLRLSSERLLEAARGIGLQVTNVRIRTSRQPFDPHTRAMETIDARMRDAHGITPVETRALAQINALFGGRQGARDPAISANAPRAASRVASITA